MSDNPFSEPDDSDRTVVQGLTPAAARASRPPLAEQPRPQDTTAFQTTSSDSAESVPRIGLSPMAAAAAPLLDLLARVGAGPQETSVQHPDELLQRAMRAVQAFQAECKELGLSDEQTKAAHYILCVSIDDVALATPWGQNGSWPLRTLASTYHQDVKGGERFFVLLGKMQETPGRYKQALEVAYLCLSLGLQGQYRLARNGHAELDRIREGLYQLLVQLRGSWERELSPHWKGVDAPHRALGRHVPLWLPAALAASVIGFGYIYLSDRVNAEGDAVQQRIAAMPPGGLPAIERPLPVAPPPPPPPPPPDNGATARIKRFLEPEVQEGLVTVEGDPQRVLVRVRGRGMFASGSADVESRFLTLMTRIGVALQTEPGHVQVLGHTDNVPIRTVRYPSNFHLSAARAKAAADILARVTRVPTRFSSEGRADTEKIASNATPEGREENRRIEIVLSTEGSR
ncbi:cell envelope biogenesis protein OmpA [Alsobacter metallidurans]|uniref:Cell envelope biogenesis protein OmpA n=1 Tax=Alsobacter metallidurans TaxID=340221 RepID=A0A917I765_9HYPH|nr:type VI secretion system protein TssL, long form [Alsobacter metallidurans]GGH20164.1 cell envelope biogenesis protein OmpA [Alsobacter metallidurans]